MNKEIVSEWKGSTRTAGIVAAEIARRWGNEEVKNYNPDTNCFTLKRWNQEGYRVKAGEKSISSITFIPMMGKPEPGAKTKEVKCWSAPRAVHLFYIKQVQKVA